MDVSMFRQYRTCIHSEFGKKSLFPMYQGFEPYSRQYFFKSILIRLVKQLPSPFFFSLSVQFSDLNQQNKSQNANFEATS